MPPKQKGGFEGRKARAGRRSNKVFPMVQLPVRVIRDIAQILRNDRCMKTLANLNCSNKLLNAITTPCLWGSISCTKKNWNPKASWNGGPSKAFKHIKIIAILGEDDDPNDQYFWAPLISVDHDILRGKTVGQLAHLWFPNLRCIFRFASPSTRYNPSNSPKPALYLSDHNVLETEDFTVLKRLLIHIEDQYDASKSASRKGWALDRFPGSERSPSITWSLKTVSRHHSDGQTVESLRLRGDQM